jgi:radical SAM protein with 4Fe4S-binding SPASM domain
MCKDIGLDYLAVKPYSQHGKSQTKKYANLRYDSYYALKDELEKINSGTFNVIFRKYTMEKLSKEERYYSKCQVTPFFWAHIMANGDVIGCGSAHLEDDRFNYGNINEHTFEEIWEGPKRRKCMDWIKNDFDIAECRKNCRMDEVNGYLWDLRHPPEHVNFI